jgi:hypothetical protein
MLCQRRDLKVCILSWTNPEVNVICGDKCWAACIALRNRNGYDSDCNTVRPETGRRIPSEPRRDDVTLRVTQLCGRM